MAKRIEKVDISDKDVFGGIKTSAESAQKEVFTLSEMLEILNKEIKTTAGNAKKIKITNAFGTVEDIKAVNVENEKAQKLAKKREELDRHSLLTKSQMQKAEQDLQKQRARSIAQLDREAKKAQEAERPYNKMSATLNKLRKEYKDLAVSGQENTASARKMREEIQRLDKTLKGADASVGQFQRNVGNYPNALKGAISQLRNFGIAFSGVALVRGAFNTIKEFDQSLANLASVLGTTADNIPKLEENAKRLGATTRFTATQVSVLQTELAKLGFTEGEIVNATDGVLALSGATGTDLARSAEVAGSTLRGFGIDASEMGRVVDVMAKSFSTSALDTEKFAESMKIVAPIAKSAGVSLEETTAMLGALANAGISGSNAGTALRRILAEVATTGKPAKEAFKELAEKGLDLAGAEDEVGKNAMSALLILNEQNGKIQELTETYKDAEGEAQKMADTQLNTLGGSLDLLSSAWDGYIMSLNDASGAGDAIAKSIKFLADNLPAIISGLAKLTAGFVAYKTAVAIANTDFKSLISNFTKFKTEAGEGTSKMSGFGNALKGIGWSVAIGLAVQLGMKLWDIASGAEAARDAMRKYEAQLKTSNEASQKKINELQEREKQRVAELNELLKDKRISQAQYVKLVEQAKSTTESELRDNKKLANDRKQRFKDLKAELLDLRQKAELEKGHQKGADAFIKIQSRAYEIAKELNISGNKTFGFLQSNAGYIQVLAQLDANIGGINKRLANYSDALKEISDSEKDFTDKTKDSSDATKYKTKAVKELTDEEKRRLQALKDLEEFNKEVEKRQRDASNEMAVVNNEYAQEDVAIDLEAEVARQSEMMRQRNENEMGLIDALLLRELQLKKKQISLEYDLLDAQAETDEERELLTRKRAIAIERVERDSKKKRKEIVDELNQAQEQFSENETARLKKTQDDEDQAYKERLQRRREFVNGVIDEMKRMSDQEIKEIDERLEAEKRFEDQLQEQANAGNISAQQSIAESKKLQQEATVEKQKEQRKQQQLDDIKTLYNLINTNIEKGDSVGVASAKAVGSMALIKTVAKMFQGFATGTDWRLGQENKPLFSGVDGHVVRVDSSEGIVRGDLMDKAEKAGISSIDEMVHRATMYGKINPQVYQMNDDRVAYIPVSQETKVDLSPLISEIKDLKNEIRNKSEFRIDPYILHGVAKGITETERKGNDIRKRTFKS